jgi:hypothetical protein
VDYCKAAARLERGTPRPRELTGSARLKPCPDT